MPDRLPFSEYWWFYAGFAAVLVLVLAVDLAMHRGSKVITARRALVWTGVWVALSLSFAGCLYYLESGRAGEAAAHQLTLEFLAGYIVEYSLSIDNMFVFALVFRQFAIPARLQHRVLFYGVAGAVVFRAIFVGIGTALVQFHWVMIAFGVFLVYTGVRLAFQKRESIRPGDGVVVRLARRLFPITPELRGSRFFVREGGILHATPLLVVLLVLETTDVVFAIDSVPAVFGVTSDPIVVYASNVLAILGLRSLYFLLADAMHRFHALKYGLSVVLVFVGVKMAWLDEAWDGRFPIGVSLAVIAGVLLASVLVSLAWWPTPAAPARATASTPPVPAREARALGAVCLLLSAAGIVALVAAWLGRLTPEIAAALSPVALALSSACWLVIGVALLRAFPWRKAAPRSLRSTSRYVKTPR